jgi:hypothetical protein
MLRFCLRGLPLAAAVAALLGPSASGGAAQGKKKEVDPAIERLLGGAVVLAIQEADRVQVVRVRPKPDPAIRSLKPGAPSHVELYPVTAKGKEQGQKFASALADVLLSKEVYDKRLPIAEPFKPTTAFRIQTAKGKDTVKVDVLLCFRCGGMSVSCEVNRFGGVQQRRETSKLPDRAYNALLKLAKEAFPDDKELQGIKPR